MLSIPIQIDRPHIQSSADGLQDKRALRKTDTLKHISVIHVLGKEAIMLSIPTQIDCPDLLSQPENVRLLGKEATMLSIPT